MNRAPDLAESLHVVQKLQLATVNAALRVFSSLQKKEQLGMLLYGAYMTWVNPTTGWTDFQTLSTSKLPPNNRANCSLLASEPGSQALGPIAARAIIAPYTVLVVLTRAI